MAVPTIIIQNGYLSTHGLISNLSLWISTYLL